MNNNQKINTDVLYIILNGSLNMSPGKAAAQAVHAAMMLGNKHRKGFMEHYRRMVVVLEAKNREQMDGIADYLSDAGIEYQYYVDEGKNEVDAFSLTAMAIEPFGSEFDEKRREIFADLPLYGSVMEDECCNTQEGPAEYIAREVSQIRRQLGQNAMELVNLREEVTKPRWYQWRAKRQSKGYVS